MTAKFDSVQSPRNTATSAEAIHASISKTKMGNYLPQRRMKKIIDLSQRLIEKGVLPDGVIRHGIRELLNAKLKDEEKDGLEFGRERILKLVQKMKGSPIAVNTEDANLQHYEVPTEFFKAVLGKYMKYSSGYWRAGVNSIDESEHDMLEITTERADLSNGQSILELGCGWGSLSLFMAQKYPNSEIIAVSNSKTQKNYIDAQAIMLGLGNIQVITSDMNNFDIHHKFDRIVSVEMFEHMRNWDKLLEKCSHFLKVEGRMFIHIFTHKEFAYLYDPQDKNDWIAQYFFTGGIMPSDDLMLYFQDHFKVEHHWRVCGTHYQKTSEAWLKRMDQNKLKLMPVFKATYGKDYQKWWMYWRVFFMSCAELWGYSDGNEWIVSHYLLKKR